MEVLNSIYRNCADSNGGIKKLYLFPYVKYSRSQITIVNNVLTSFPQSTIFEFEPLADYSAEQSGQENEGGKFFDLSLSFQIANHPEISKFLNKYFRAVILDRNGNYRLLGTFNGLSCNSVNKSSGSGKADFSGFKLSFDGMEILEAPFFTSLDIVTGAESYLIQENGDYLLQENGFKIIL